MSKDVLFRCSRLGDLLTNGRGKDAGMGDTSKGLVLDLFIEDRYGRRKDIYSKEMYKGTHVEEDSISLLTEVTGRLYVKNVKRYTNEWITGTPDIITDTTIIDIKSSWDIWTFAKADLSKAYEAQLRGYMMLTGREEAQLVYCLVNNPPEQIIEAQKRLYFMFNCDEENDEYIRQSDRVERNMVYDDIAPEERVKVFTIKRDVEWENALIERVKEARVYYDTLKLNG